MHYHRFSRFVAAGAAGLTGLAGVTALPGVAASATPSSINITRTCAGGGTANLQVQREDTGLLSVDFGVDMGRHVAAVPWQVKEARNGKIFVSTRVKTVADGSFSLTRVLNPLVGKNSFVASAVNTHTGMTCSIKGSL